MSKAHKPAIRIIGFAPVGTQVTSVSPFAGKLEVMMRIANLPYAGYRGSPTEKKVAPKGKLPTIKHGDDLVADTSVIVEYLARHYPTEMAVFTPADPQRQALASALQRMLEEHTYFAFMYYLWVVPSINKPFLNRLVAGFDVHPLFRPMIKYFVRRETVQNLHGQGMERLTFEEVQDRVVQDLDVLEECLKHNRYLTGATPTAADCFLLSLLDLMHGSLTGLKAQTRCWDPIATRPSLVAFYSRFKDEVFPHGPSSEWKERFSACPGRSVHTCAAVQLA